VVISKEHPKNIAASIAMKPIPKTADLVQQSLSRFSGSNSSDVSQLVEGSN
jgi:O-acetylhomoserine/O-acetylserine sulfhydrylase-like pyridoxal-dependent enzyme